MDAPFEGHSELIDIVILVDDVKGIQYRFTVTEFYDKHYIGIRKWFLGFEGDWIPTKEGVTMPYTLDTTTALWKAFTELLSEAEVLHEVAENAAKQPDIGE